MQANVYYVFAPFMWKLDDTNDQKSYMQSVEIVPRKCRLQALQID